MAWLFLPRKGLNMAGKRIHEVKISIDDDLLVDLSRLAIVEDRKLSDLIHVILLKHVYGHVPRIDCELEGRIREKGAL